MILPSASLPVSSDATCPSRPAIAVIAFCRVAATSSDSTVSEPVLMIARVMVGWVWAGGCPGTWGSAFDALPSAAVPESCFWTGAASLVPALSLPLAPHPASSANPNAAITTPLIRLITHAPLWWFPS